MWRTSPSPQNCEDVTNVSTCSQRSPEKATGATCPTHTPFPKTQGYSEKCYFFGGLRCECARPQCASVPSLSLSHTHTHTSHIYSLFSLLTPTSQVRALPVWPSVSRHFTNTSCGRNDSCFRAEHTRHVCRAWRIKWELINDLQ